MITIILLIACIGCTSPGLQVTQFEPDEGCDCSPNTCCRFIVTVSNDAQNEKAGTILCSLGRGGMVHPGEGNVTVAAGRTEKVIVDIKGADMDMGEDEGELACRVKSASDVTSHEDEMQDGHME
jgi:hypothetical protein